MDRLSLCDCLIAWIKSLNLDVNSLHFNDLRDGILISKCLNYIDPSYFNDEWLTKIKADTNENWRLKLLNFKKIVESIRDYYFEILPNLSIDNFQMPNLNVYIETNDCEELSRILQLVLGCAVNCERKSEFIQSIMEMPVDSQHIIMQAIQDLMAKERNKSNSSDDDTNHRIKKIQNDLNRANESRDEFEHKCKSLESQVSLLKEEKQSLMSEITILQQKFHENESDKDNDKKLIKLQLKIDSMQEELYKIDALKEEYRIKYETTKIENDALIEKNIELKKLSNETQNLKDEIDILKHNRDKVNKLESTIETYKIKLEEMSDLKSQMRLLEDTNTQYMETIIKMEEETKKIQTLKNQIEMYKKQVQDLHENIRIQEMKVKKYEFENKRLEERLAHEQNEKEQLGNVVDRLKETNESLQLNLNTSTLESTHNTSNTSLTNGSFSELELINVPFELKEKIFRLYHENKILKAKQIEFDEEKLLILQNQYDDEKAKSNDLQVKFEEAQLQIINLEAKISDLKYSYNNKSPKNVPSDEESRKLQQKIDHLTIEKNIMREQLNNKEKEIFELNDLNEKYRNYLEKAKIVIKSLDPVNNPTSNNEIQNLKNQLSEKDKYIKQILKEQEKMKLNHEKEEQLLMSAWQKLVVNLNEQTMEERLKSIGSSFLSQQRHLPPPNKRQISTTSLPPSTNGHHHK